MCLNPGDIIGSRYKIICQLGCGGFGKTYKAKDTGKPGNPLCVVKEITLPQSNDPHLLPNLEKRFEREAKTLYRLGDHSQIPKLFAYFQANGKFYLVQEYIDGHDLRQELTPGKQLREEEVIELLQEILEVLKVVHRQNVIHRDIKPSNLMRRKQDGKIVLIDFGAVKEISSLTFTSPGEINLTQGIGTPGYMPAEQQNGNPQLSSDIYAVGMICLRALTGLDPRNLPLDRNTGDIIWRYSTSNRQMVEVSPELETILNKMVRYLFSDRYYSAAEALEALRQMNSSPALPVKSKLIGYINRFGESKKRLWFGLGLAAAAFFIIMILRLVLTQKTCTLELADDLSCGEEILVQGESLPEKKEGVKAFAKGKYKEAVTWLEQARQKQPNDPETLIYLNNARLAATKAQVYTIAVAAPIGDPSDGGDSGKEILRGVAQVQSEINQGKKIKGFSLRVLIADDYNDPNRANQVAQKLVKQPGVLAVVGHYSSGNTLAALPIYNMNNLVLISPTSTSQKLAQENPVFFRTVPRDSVNAEALADYLLKKAQQQKVAVFYNPKSAYSRSLNNQFFISFDEGGGQVVKQFDLSKPIFNPNAAIEQAKKRGATGFVLFPDAKVDPYAFLNALKVIRANQNRYLMAGGDSLYTTDILQERALALNIVVSIPWHDLNSPNREFTTAAKNLWGGSVSWRTAMAYDATRVLTVALQNQSPLNPIESLQAWLDPSIRRSYIQQSLKKPDFRATGGTGEISLEPTGDRQDSVVELVKVVPYKCSPYGYTFIPLQYATASAAGLKCN
ncbi:MAG: ABC transporter substrate-binding protein [Xenococcaceae cyanobacterium]